MSLGVASACKLGLRLTVRTVIVIMIMSVRAVYWFVEQPGSSKVIHFPELKHLQKLIWASGMKTYFQRLSGSQTIFIHSKLEHCSNLITTP